MDEERTYQTVFEIEQETHPHLYHFLNAGTHSSYATAYIAARVEAASGRSGFLQFLQQFVFQQPISCL